MLLQPDCILCIYKASLAAIRGLTDDEERIKEIVSELLRMPSLQEPDWQLTSPEVFETVLRKISQLLNDKDPFSDLKEQQNAEAMELYPWLKELVGKSENRLETAVKLAVMGNSLDLMWSNDSVEIEPLIEKCLDRPLDPDQFESFEKKLSETSILLILGDNAGEIVFDKLLIETIRSSFNPAVVYVVRSVPTLNDATFKDAATVGLDKVATVLENGIDGPFPGTKLSRCSEHVRKLVEGADLIIAKGGGNFDSLAEETHLHDRIFFMLVSKCRPYCNYFGTDTLEPILATAGEKQSGEQDTDPFA